MPHISAASTESPEKRAMAEQTLHFQAEVSKLLEIVVNSLYSEKEIFLRELISNASDACDRLRYAALTEPSLNDGGAAFKIAIAPDKKARTLTISDNGIGMNRDELIENLGTIARSGTAAFLAQLSGDARKDVALIGQFGVGFYSAFMVAEKVEVVARKAGEQQGWRWTSDGKGEFTIVEEEGAERGVRIVMHLRAGEDEFLDPHRLRAIVRSYSDHIAIPVVLIEDGKEETVNSASALWTRPRSEITEEQYREFYHHSAHALDDPWLTIHYRAEGAIEYTGLLFVPTRRPFDLFEPGRKPQVRLYVKRVFITADSEGLLPPYLRFLRGVVDTPDLPLNVSRELLQTSPLLAKMRSGLIKRVLGELKKKAEDSADDYRDVFWANFGAVLKEGIYEDFERRDDILDLCRFASTVSDKPTSLADYVARMKPGQEAIYTIGGDDVAALRRSPHLEGFIAKGVEVLLLADPIDEFWPQAVGAFKDKPFKSVAQGAVDLAKIEGASDAAQPQAEPAADLEPLIGALKASLGDAVKDVRASERLTESAVCLIAEDGDMSLHLERLLRQHRRDAATPAARILEINPRHALIRRLAEAARSGGDGKRMTDAAWLLLDQARLVDGEPPVDPVAFARRLAAVLERAI
jgi:molecular chaperone HtpG